MALAVDHPAETELARRLDQLETVCAELYQVLGTLGAPGRVLAQASAAAEGRPLPYTSLLPFSVKDAKPRAAAALLGARGGIASTMAKRLAAAKNGLLGGRPRRRVAYKIGARKK